MEVWSVMTEVFEIVQLLPVYLDCAETCRAVFVRTVLEFITTSRICWLSRWASFISLHDARLFLDCSESRIAWSRGACIRSSPSSVSHFHWFMVLFASAFQKHQRGEGSMTKLTLTTVAAVSRRNYVFGFHNTIHCSICLIFICFFNYFLQFWIVQVHGAQDKACEKSREENDLN